jgi:hypothetical protein
MASLTAAWSRVLFAASLLWPASAPAQSANFIRDCQSWIERRGYSTDYIEAKTGRRQPGLASSWRGNIQPRDVRPGDVVLLRLRAPGAMHAAYVEEVRKSADGALDGIRVSEWNWGRMSDARCLVTENFGRLAPPRWIELSAVAHVWRPSLAAN